MGKKNSPNQQVKDKACVFKYSNYLKCGVHVECVYFFFVSCFYCNTECSLWFQHSFRLLIALPLVTMTYSNVRLCIWTDTVLTIIIIFIKFISTRRFITHSFGHIWGLVANCKVYILTRSF